MLKIQNLKGIVVTQHCKSTIPQQNFFKKINGTVKNL